MPGRAPHWVREVFRNDWNLLQVHDTSINYILHHDAHESGATPCAPQRQQSGPRQPGPLWVSRLFSTVLPEGLAESGDLVAGPVV